MRLKRIRNSNLLIILIIFCLSLLLINIQFPNRTINESKMNEDPLINVISPSDIHNKLNTTICNANYGQTKPQVIEDGLGGAIIVWEDNRSNTNMDIYAQHVNSSGHPLWNLNGIAICNDSDNSRNPTLVSDGNGGAIISWEDDGNGLWKIFCQHINAAGQTQWTNNGTVLSSGTYNDTNPHIVSDGSGGAIVTWHTYVTNFGLDFQVNINGNN